jgi:hypothetical protein
MKIKIKLPPGYGPKSAQNLKSHEENDSPGLPPDLPVGGGGTRTYHIKNGS